MTTEPRYPEIKVDLSDDERNAFKVIGQVTLVLFREGVDDHEIDRFQNEAISTDRDHVLAVAEQWITVE